MNKHRFSTLLLVPSSLIVLGVFTALSLGRYANLNPRFDRQVWLAYNDESRDNPRLNMVEDLRRQYLRVGLSREQVTSLLGEPKGASFVMESGVHCYMLGFQGIDPSFLCIEFDANQRVRKIWRFDR